MDVKLAKSVCGIILIFSGHIWAEITVPPDDTESVVGEDVTLTCRSNITNPARNPVRWLFRAVHSKHIQTVYVENTINGFQERFFVTGEISNGDYSLTIKNVTLQDAGRYTCVDIFSYGNPNHNAEMSVFAIYPTIGSCSTNALKGAIICNNNLLMPDSLLRLSCNVSYQSNLDVFLEWRLSDQVVDVSVTSSTTSGITTSELVSKTVWDGPYTCSVQYKNSHLTDLSRFRWSTSFNITSLTDATMPVSSENVGCQNVECGISVKHHELSCKYRWELETNNSIILEDSTLNLTDKPNERYMCIAECSTVNENKCTFVERLIDNACSIDFVDQEKDLKPAYAEQLTGGSIAAVVLAVVLILLGGVLLGLYIFYKRRRKCLQSQKAKPDDTESPDNEGMPNNNEEGPRVRLSNINNNPLKSIDDNETLLISNGTVGTKEKPLKSNDAEETSLISKQVDDISFSDNDSSSVDDVPKTLQDLPPNILDPILSKTVLEED